MKKLFIISFLLMATNTYAQVIGSLTFQISNIVDYKKNAKSVKSVPVSATFIAKVEKKITPDKSLSLGLTYTHFTFDLEDDWKSGTDFATFQMNAPHPQGSWYHVKYQYVGIPLGFNYYTNYFKFGYTLSYDIFMHPIIDCNRGKLRVESPYYRKTNLEQSFSVGLSTSFIEMYVSYTYVFNPYLNPTDYIVFDKINYHPSYISLGMTFKTLLIKRKKV